jgi:hypothetical protein
MVLPFLILIHNVINDNRLLQPRLTILPEYLIARLLHHLPFFAGIHRLEGENGPSAGIPEECGTFSR